VDKSLVEAAEAARELAGRTGTPLVVRESKGIQTGVQTGSGSNPPLDAPADFQSGEIQG
jgi:hypothetical protein